MKQRTPATAVTVRGCDRPGYEADVLNVTKYRNAPDAFVARTLARYVIDLGGCWLWTGSTTRDGYAQANYKLDGRQFSVYPHVLAYLAHNGELDLGQQIDHSCHDPETCIEPCVHRRCINPAHLVQMPGAENNRRSGSPPAVNARRTHCPEGHEYDTFDGASRRCSTCRAEDARRSYQRNGAAANARRAEKMRTDPEYRERRLAARRARSHLVAARNRERYATDEAYRERVKAAGRRWYERQKAR